MGIKLHNSLTISILGGVILENQNQLQAMLHLSEGDYYRIFMRW